MEQYNVIANQPIVIDNGSGVIKAGFAGDEIPKCNFRNNVSRPKHSKIMAGALEGDTFIGQIAEDNRGEQTNPQIVTDIKVILGPSSRAISGTILQTTIQFLDFVSRKCSWSRILDLVSAICQ